MSQVIQAKCPQCQQILRIPSVWLTQAMKCKHCAQIFQARAKTGISATTPLPPHAAASAPLTLAPAVNPAALVSANSAPTVNFDPFGFDQLGQDASVPALPPAPKPRRPRGNLWKAAALFGAVLAIGGVVLAVARPWLSSQFRNSSQDDEPRRIAEGKNKKSPVPPAIDNSKSKTPPDVAEDPPKQIDDGLPKKGPKKLIPKSENPAFPTKETTPKVAAGAFPRRALLINVSNYLLFNPLHYGNGRQGGYPGSSTATLSEVLTRPPLNIPGSQITELSDGGRMPHPTTKGAIEAAISDFADTARDQDRIIVLFTGHALEIEKEGYLVPVEGNRDDPRSLVPLSWVYDKLAKCRARQKLLVLDVFRYPPARGEELPGTDVLTEDFDAKLLNPPPGVQVWTACVKDQKSIEFELGSVFLQALCHTMQERLPGIAEPTEPLPLDQLVPKVNQRMKELLDPQKLQQISRLTGKEADGGAAYDATQPLAPALALRNPTRTGEDAAGMAMVKNILEEINLFPGAKGSGKQLPLASLPPFPAKVLDEYKADYKTAKELEEMVKDKDKYPLRAAFFEAQKSLKAQEIQMEEYFSAPGGVTGKVKDMILAKQQPVGLMDFQLKKLKKLLEDADDKRDMETSKRWLAHYDLAVARVKARMVFVNEYNTVLALVRQDALPELMAGDSGWRIGLIGAPSKLATKEPFFKDMNKEMRKSLTRFAKEHANTPWAIVATREYMTALGLEWRSARQ